MRGERQLLRLGEHLVGRASRQLPRKVREERYREWAAELPAVLHDPQIRFAPRRALRMLGYAADTFRGTALTAVRSRRRRLELIKTALLSVLLPVCLALMTWVIWDIVRAPGQPVNYLQLVWVLLLAAWQVRMLMRPAAGAPVLIMITANAMGVAVNLWNTVQDPGDWVNYLFAGIFTLLVIALWFVWRRDRTTRGSAARKQA